MLWQVFGLAAVLVSVAGHGRVTVPPSRASMWRSGYSTKPNYDDDGLNCGGFYHQYSVTGGKCGICGDPYDMAQPRAHELGGTYGSGIITGNYEEGQVITVTVYLSVYHKGYWTFQICPDPYYTEQDCFDANPVELEEGGTKYYPTKSAEYTLNYRLPAGLVCEHCVLQWRYVAGNNWGVCTNGTQGLGCGNQENFGACSDISISGATKAIEVVPAEIYPLPVSLLADLNAQGLLNLLHIATINSYRIRNKENKIKKKKKKNHRRPRNKKKPAKRKKVYW